MYLLVGTLDTQIRQITVFYAPVAPAARRPRSLTNPDAVQRERGAQEGPPDGEVVAN